MHTRLGSRVVSLTGLPLLAIHTGDIDDAAPAFFHHVRDHLFGHVKHGVQIGLDHHIPVFAGHFQEHAVTGDTCVVHQHINAAVFGLGLRKRLDSGIPIAHIAHRRVKGVAQSSLLGNPFHMVAGGATTGDDFKTFLVQTLADSGTNTTHATRYIRYFLTHCVLLF